MNYEIYERLSGETEDATSNGASYTIDGGCPLDAVVKIINELHDSARLDTFEGLDKIDELAAFDNNASAYACRIGEDSFEVHVQVDNVDNWFTLNL